MIIPDKTHDFEEVAGFDFRRGDQIKDKQSALPQGQRRDRFIIQWLQVTCCLKAGYRKKHQVSAGQGMTMHIPRAYGADGQSKI